MDGAGGAAEGADDCWLSHPSMKIDETRYNLQIGLMLIRPP
ncbi:hypothetical protein JCM19233_876 [Vibrio astriarenae]|nr:hypothetical protein JCM19233_876 [Vibrio sp. C7]